MRMKDMLARTPAAAVAGLLLISGPAGGLPGSAARTAAGPHGAAGAAASGTITGSAVPSPGLSSSLQGVTCTSAGNCWAVGSYEAGTAQLNQALHWNGTRWSRVATPDPGLPGSGAHALDGVSCASRASCWAVGSHVTDSGASRNAVLRWNGISWSAVSVPGPGAGAAGDGSELSGVACRPAGDCVAVGGYLDGAAAGQNEALRWNGTRWRRSAVPDRGALSSITCTAAARCWAVRGQPSGKAAIGWNGTSWSAVTTPGSAELNGVACATAASCVAVGNHAHAGALLNNVLGWNGATWSAIAVPDPGGAGAGAQNRLAAVACAAAANCWAVGSYWDTGAAGRRDVALHWNGHAWSSQQAGTGSGG